MARKSPSRIQLRKEAEAAEASKKAGGGEAKKKEKKEKKPSSAKRSSSRSKDKTPQRKRLLWGVFSGSMKEEGRFPYDQLAAAEEKAEQLRAKSKKLYFIQPIKEVIAEPAPVAEAAVAGGKEKKKG
jgi:hypothetical protein